MTDTTKMLELLALLSMMRDLETLLCVTRKLSRAEILMCDVKASVSELELTIRYDDPDDKRIRELAERARKTHAKVMEALVSHSLQ